MVQQEREEEITPGLVGVGGRTPGLAGVGGRTPGLAGVGGRNHSWFSRSGRKKGLLVQQEWEEEITPRLAGLG